MERKERKPTPTTHARITITNALHSVHTRIERAERRAVWLLGLVERYNTYPRIAVWLVARWLYEVLDMGDEIATQKTAINAFYEYDEITHKMYEHCTLVQSAHNRVVRLFDSMQ